MLICMSLKTLAVTSPFENENGLCQFFFCDFTNSELNIFDYASDFLTWIL